MTVVYQGETDSYYDIRLAYKPYFGYPGKRGLEHFTVDKAGTIRDRVILSAPELFLNLDKVVRAIKRILPAELRGWVEGRDQRQQIDYPQRISDIIDPENNPGLTGRLMEGLESEEQRQSMIAKLHQRVGQLVQDDLKVGGPLSSEAEKIAESASNERRNTEPYRKANNQLAIANLAAKVVLSVWGALLIPLLFVLTSRGFSDTTGWY